MIEDIKKIFLHYGCKVEKNKAVEELSELIRAISKDDIDNIIEEIADVEIILEHLKLIYNISQAKILSIKHEKIKRQLKRMNDENN